MSKKHTFTTFVAVALGMLAALPSAFAVGTTGDIRSIEAVPESRYTASAPLTVSDVITVRVRLLNQDFLEANLGTPHQWEFRPSWWTDAASATIPSDWQSTLSKPALRLAIGGKIVNAEYVEMTQDGYMSGLKDDYYTDLYFEYKVKEGELGQPVRLVTRSGSVEKIVNSDAGFGAAGFSLYGVQTYLNPYGSWKLTNDKGAIATFKYVELPIADMDRAYPDPGDGHMEFSRIYPGVNVKTIDFEGDENTVDGWRQVYAGSSDYTGAELALSGRGPATVYVWTEDDAIATPDGATEVNADGHKVLGVTLRSDGNPTPFKVIGGVGQEGKTVKLFLSSTKAIARDAQDEEIADSVLTRTIKVIGDTRLPSITLERATDKLQTFDVVAEADYRTATRVRLATPQSFTSDFTVKLNITKDGQPYSPDADNYFKVLLDGADPAQAASIDAITVRAGAKETYFNIYGLGSNADLAEKGVKITPEIPDTETGAKDYFKQINGATVMFVDVKPEIKSVKAPKTGMAGGKIDLEVTLADNWRDMQADQAINPEVVHTLEITIGGAVVYSEKSTKPFVESRANTFTVEIPASALTNPTTPCTIRAKDATHEAWSDPYEFTIAVSRKEAVAHFFETDLITSAVRDVTTVKEGETAYVRVDLSEQYTASSIYAYLVVTDDAMTNFVATSKIGAEIDPNRNPLRSDLIPITFIDGTVGSDVKLEVRLSTKANWDDNDPALVDGYATNTPLTFTVINAAPYADRVLKGDTQIADGGSIKVPGGTVTSFTADILDPGIIDSESLEVMWIIDGQGGDDDLNPDEAFAGGTSEMDLYFPEEDTDYKVLVLARDKDHAKYQEGDNTWNKKSVVEGGDCLFTFIARAGVMPMPVIEFVNDDTSIAMFEDGDSEENSFNVKVNEFPSPKDCYSAEEAIGGKDGKELKVKVTIVDVSKDGGVLKLLDPENENAEPTNSVTLSFADARSAKSGKTVHIDVDSQNGGTARPSKFKIKAEVINTERNKAKQRWKDYYGVNQKSVINMYNRTPTIRLESADASHSFSMTNNWIAGETVTLKWTITDTLHDVTGGLFRVRWDLADTSKSMSTNVTADAVIAGGTVARTTATGTYKFVVPDCRAPQKFSVTADDGEGGEATQEFYIVVTPTKKISINVAGPAMTDTKYSAAKGIGSGHVFMDAMESTGSHYVRQFRQTWSFSQNTPSINVYARGFTKGDTANGSLGGKNYIGADVNALGDDWTPGDASYVYDDDHNSYFYAWQVLDENGKVTDTLVSPQVATNFYASKQFKLGDLTGSSSSNSSAVDAVYNTVQIEAIFSREYIKGDNLGDINADGIPDILARKYALGGSEAGEYPADDFADLSEENDDEDYLPALDESRFRSLVPGLAGTWANNKAMAFTAKKEIRGYGDELHDAMKTLLNANERRNVACTPVSAATLSDPAEYESYREYCTLHGLDYKTANIDPLTGSDLWSPENPTDPTLADTDDDGLPDGYEYYFWYWAKVGKYANSLEIGNANITNSHARFSRLVGERFDPYHPEKGTIIEPAEIAELMDPNKARGDKKYLSEWDSDNDGLSDIKEFDYGTNPFHWDTDGDGMPDGWEIYRSNTNPLVADAGNNADGDFMAKMTLGGYTIMCVDPTDEKVPTYEGYGRYYATITPNDKPMLEKYGYDTNLIEMVKHEDPEEYRWMFAVGYNADKLEYYMVNDPTLELTNLFAKTETVAITNLETMASVTNDLYYLKRELTLKELMGVSTNRLEYVTNHWEYVEGTTDINLETLDITTNKLNSLTGPAQLRKGTVITDKPIKVPYVDWQTKKDLKGLDGVFTNRCYEVWVYGKKGEFVVADFADLPAGTKLYDHKRGSINLLHHQVYQRRGWTFSEEEYAGVEEHGGGLIEGIDFGTGFNPCTAWYKDDNGYVNSRWSRGIGADPVISTMTTVTMDGDGIHTESNASEAGRAVDTVPFTALDEFLLVNFRERCGQVPHKEIQANLMEGRSWESIWANNTTRAGYQKAADATEEPNQARAADTDGDGAVDGWELYCGMGPSPVNRQFRNYVIDANTGKPKSRLSPLNADDNMMFDDMGKTDLLGAHQEAVGTDVYLAYANCPSVQSKKNVHTSGILNQGGSEFWLNKFWPTDPYNWDTDGDGLSDDEEYSARFIYGRPTDNGTTCIAGAGLNPCSWDTDMDGLPDMWENQYIGMYVTPTNQFELVGNKIAAEDYNRRMRREYEIEKRWTGPEPYVVKHGHFVGGMDATVPDSYTKDVTVVGEPEILNINRDYDFDGLDPWQEYLTGLIRPFRYDDPLSPWKVTTKEEAEEMLKTDAKKALELWLHNTTMLVDANGEQTCALSPLNKRGTNPNLVFGVFDAWGAYGSKCNRKWDKAYGQWYYFPDGPNHCLREANNTYAIQYAKHPFMPKKQINEQVELIDYDKTGSQAGYPLQYATTSPIDADSDHDGMDDYYELFHGLNPLYGGKIGDDLIAEAWGNSVTATKNYWIAQTNVLAAIKVTVDGNEAAKQYDFVKFPWMAGDPEADPDGDGIRNIDEAINPNIQASKTYLHTDPTPLWMTDSTHPGSLVNGFYLLPNTGDLLNKLVLEDEMFTNNLARPKVMPMAMASMRNRWGALKYNFDFEENEGFDSDHDGLSDFQEVSANAANYSDAQHSDDPHRRQAMYFQGNRSALQSLESAIVNAATPSIELTEFTVECWVKPEEQREQVILERTVKTTASNPGDSRYYRRNFQLGIDALGRFYAAYDHNGTGPERVMATASEPFALGKWYHLAMTYNGKELCLYINGIYTAGDSRGLRPVTPQLVSLSAIDYEFLSSTLSWNNTWDHILKAKSDSFAMIFGASAKEIKPGDEIASALVLDEDSEWAGYEKFYQGYLSEVRIWDGARKASDIAADVDSRKRYTSEDVAANRKAIFDASRGSWRGTGASRHDGTLEPELLYLYNFGQLFASASIGSIAQTPFGYTAGIEFGGKAACVRPTNWKCGFWSKLPLHSLVYRDYSWVPWIPNLVATQPSLDGTTYDSAYMSSEYKGFIPADSVGLESYNFPQTHELYPRRQTVKTPSISTQSTRWSQMLHYATKNSITDPDKDFKVFQDAHAQLEKTMLLPLGFAYVKYCEDFWDEEGPSTTWSVIGTDENNNGIGDWWEIIHYGEIYDENGKLKPDAIEMYHRDIANGQYPNMNPTKPADLYKQVADENKNGLPDWWEELYALGGASGTDDSDNDGLSNYTEYLLSEVFKLGKFNPRNAFSVDSNKLDYFAKVGELYVGEIFTDHDLINDVWERLWDEDKISAHSFDANVDSDGDGWSNYAEYRANTNPGEISTPSISDKAGNNYAITEHPVPVIHANVKYNGSKALSGTLVFKAWNERFDKDMVGSPDAIWTIGASTESSTSEDGAVTITSQSVSHEKFLGKKPMGKQTYYLGGGAIAEGSFKVYFLDKGFSEVTFDDETGDVVGISNGRPEDAVWYYHIFDRDGMLVRIGNALSGNDTIVGTIDYKSGAVTINFDDDEFSGLKYGVPSDAQTSDKTTTYHYFDMDNAYVKMGWDSSTIGSVIGDHVLADADQPGAIASRGYVREGKNSFICFLDSDGDGKYTPGEQFGYVGGVDVGWSGATFDITLSETHPVFARVDVYSGKSDREYWYGTESGNIQTSGGIIPGDKKVRVRVFRTLVNGIGIGRTIDPNDNTPTGRLNLENVCVLDKLMDLDERNYIHEGDFIGAGQLDIEWDTLFKGVIKAEEVTSQYIDVTNMTYRIVMGNGDISPDTTNNLVSVAISRNFDGDDYRKRALPIDIGRVETARPTLRWTMEGGAYNSYPVFQVKIYDGATEIYDSGERSISELAIDSNNAYSWQLPICVGDTIPQSGKTFANGKAYTYTVAMLNSKFRYDYDEDKDHVSELKKRAGAFFTNVPSANGACGAASFDVRYYGPAAAYQKNVLTNEQKQVITIKPVIRVQAFSSPDFTGTPIGATATSEFANGAVDAKVIGLPAGTCYFLAFIDANDNGKCDAWETKGWYSTRAAATDAMIAPKAVKMSANMGVTGTIYLEDADTDHDGIPDGYEYVKFGSLGENGSTYIDEPSEEMKKAGVTLFEGLKAELEKSLTKSLGTAKTVKSIMNTLNNANVAALIMGLEPTANGEFKLPEPTVLENGVVIKSVTFEPAAGAVTMTVAAQAEGAMTPEAAAIYATEGMATVQLTLEYSEDLKSWTKTEPITISVTSGTTEKTVSATVEELKGSQAGFFRVSIDQ